MIYRARGLHPCELLYSPPFPWKQMEERVLPRFLDCPLLAPLIEATPIGRGAFTLIADVWKLKVIYKPSFTGAWARAEICEPWWWVAKLGVEDQAEYLAVRLAAELRVMWKVGR